MNDLKLTNPSGPDLSNSAATSLMWAGARRPLLRGTVLYHTDFLCPIVPQPGATGDIVESDFLHTPTSMKIGNNEFFTVSLTTPPFRAYQLSAWIKKETVNPGASFAMRGIVLTPDPDNSANSEEFTAIVNLSTPGSETGTVAVHSDALVMVPIFSGLNVAALSAAWSFFSYIFVVGAGSVGVIFGPYEHLLGKRDIIPLMKSPVAGLNFASLFQFTAVGGEWFVDSFTVTGW